jgi:spore germination protein GerM
MNQNTDSIRKLSILLLTLIAVFACLQTAGAQTSSTRLKEVKIYLAKSPYDNSDPNNPHGFATVTRRVNAKSPLRPTLVALTKGPTEAEKKSGFESPTFGIQLLSVSIKRGVAYTYFTMPEGATFSGDGSPFIFEDAVRRTAMQFPTVRKVVVCLDGILDFGSESDEPSKKCPRP